ncbi:hypothetical protein MIND_00656200 [Mycena indigotica]|uniref:Uncharacterized protein n=1 Tax=Mycena indigotica TaxID=2126181 RepID=A0A8H6W420_9AGAR|nr:uncharacterized protein MIND_00656200 [Mycena indigotica]KAF7300933.1 hypothetical protein MIND_00656200 [Mycena indigotica]
MTPVSSSAAKQIAATANNDGERPVGCGGQRSSFPEWLQPPPGYIRGGCNLHTLVITRLEPFLYRHVYISPDCARQRAMEAFFYIIDSKPPSFLAKSVRRIVLEFFDGSEMATEELVNRVYAALRLCTGVQEIVVNASDEMDIGRTLFPIFSAMPLCRLGVFLEDLMPHPVAMASHAAAFPFLTHLEVYDNEGHSSHSRDLLRVIPFVVALPKLTHLALHVLLGATVVKKILNECYHLEVLAFVTRAPHPIFWPFMEGIQHLSQSLGDPRIMGTTCGQWMEALSDVRDGFWRVLEIFIDQKRRGLIHDHHALTGDIHALTTTDTVAKQLQALIADKT